jgi:Fe-S-cluster containining protein
MTVYEAFALADDFIFNLVFTFIPKIELAGLVSPERLATHRQFDLAREHFGAATLMSPEGNNWAVTVSAKGVCPPSTACTMLLDDGKCRIHDRRPALCRALPFDYFLADEDQDLATSRLERKIHEEGWPCRTDADAPLVWRDGKFAPGPVADAVRFARTHKRLFADAALEMFKMLYQGRDVLREFAAQGTLAMPLGQLVDYIDALDWITEESSFKDDPLLRKVYPSAKDFYRKQVPLIEAMIARNLAVKNKQDRANTQYLRDMLGMYQSKL